MTTGNAGRPNGAAAPEHLDVVIVGAGISGIGMGRYLRTLLPHKQFTILEARADLGGTWDLFRYPGIRSDSDLHTFGYEFKPWRGTESIADGAQIMTYLRETVQENRLEQSIRYQHRVVDAAWSSEQARWTVRVERQDTAEQFDLTATWLVSAAGYYSYDAGYIPDFPGRHRFTGTVVHPQHWPADLDYHGKRVVIIGSGATAVTLAPALAATAAHVTIVQRTPTYVLPMPKKDAIANTLKRVLGVRRGYAATRRMSVARDWALWSFCRKYPTAARRIIRSANASRLPAGFPVDEHFNPPYHPWDQRLCVAPDGDLFDAIRRGEASMVTEQIATFTENGIRLASGRELDADIIVTATGLNLQSFGGARLRVDGQTVNPPDTVAYKGLMLSGVPNLAYVVGYTNISWTLKIGLLGEYFCRLLGHMDSHGYRVARAEVAGPAMELRPVLDGAAGYVQRAVRYLPKQGDRKPWQTSLHYRDDARLLRGHGVVDPELHFDPEDVPERLSAADSANHPAR
ncbi:flavin-containing monooxygenase [Nocardia sp. NPDC127579]|uniref:flavin-containing monooxygenase n=1 Tax=Nocardia sp. NPDC127579 TaxID=3345402 RepID=UPI003634E2DD